MSNTQASIRISQANTLVGTLTQKGSLSGKVSANIRVNVEDTQMYILVTDDGTEIPAVVVSEETVFDATADDIRLGKIAATDSGVTVGEKVIPGYLAHDGIKIIRPNAKFEIQLSQNDQYDYTLLDCIICNFNTNASNSVAADKVVINDAVYPVQSTTAICTVTKNHESQTIDLGFTNETGKNQILRYITFKEIY